MRISVVILFLNLISIQAYTQRESTDLTETMRWILAVLNHKEIVKYEDGTVSSHDIVVASFNDKTSQLTVEQKSQEGEKIIYYTKQVISLATLDENSFREDWLSRIDLEIKDTLYWAHISFYTKGRKKLISYYDKDLVKKKEMQQMTHEAGITLFPSQLKLNKNLHQEWKAAFKRAIILSRN